MRTQEELDTQWYSNCCYAPPAYPPGEVDEHCSAFCSKCGEGSGFERYVAVFPGFPTDHGGVDFVLIQNPNGFFVGMQGVADSGTEFSPDDEEDRIPWEEFKKDENKEIVAQIAETIEANRR